MRFMKPSRLVTPTRWCKWRLDFNQVLDVVALGWADVACDLESLFPGYDATPRGHFPNRNQLLFNYPGAQYDQDVSNRRTSGRKSRYAAKQKRDRSRRNAVLADVSARNPTNSTQPLMTVPDIRGVNSAPIGLGADTPVGSSGVVKQADSEIPIARYALLS